MALKHSQPSLKIILAPVYKLRLTAHHPAEHLKTVERKVVAAALVAAENDVELAAKMLHLSVSELFDKKQTLDL